MRTRRYRKRGGEGEVEGTSAIDNAKSGITNFFGDFSKKAEEAKNSGLGLFDGLTKSATDATSGLMGNQPAAPSVGGKRRKSKRKRTKRTRR